MNRLVLAGLGLLALLAAVLVRPSRPPQAADGAEIAALGRSLGPLRVALVDLLFLRAEALRRAGRAHEVPVLYETALALDPDNVAAVDLLAATYAYDLLDQAPDEASRFGWWREAWDLLATGLRRHPDADALRLAQAELLLQADLQRPELGDPVRAAVGPPRAEALERLLAVARHTGNAGRRGRSHLARLALLLPDTAAQWMLAGRREEAARLLDEAEVVLERRREDLAAMPFTLEEGAGGEAPPSLGDLLEASVDLLRLVLAGEREAARSAAAAYAARFPESPLLAHLGALLG